MDSRAPTPAPSTLPPPPHPEPEPPLPPTRWQRFKRTLLGGPKDIQDPQLFQHISLAAFLAWVGLGADGLSSSAYGPEEAFKNLGEHQYLAVFLALLTAFTVLVIAAAYSKIIEHFPFGGGGYVVATRLLGPRSGVISGSALLVDYVLTISVSIASGADAVFSSLPASTHWLKLPSAVAVIALLTVLNLRGVKESVSTLVPVFLVFLATHVVMIGGSVFFHLGRAGEVAREVSTGLSHDLKAIGFVALAGLFLRAYSLGAGTYTGIEAVSNGLQIMREPRVATAKRTMVYMAVSLALTAAGIILGYLLMNVHPVEGKTMNAVLAGELAGSWQLAGVPIGKGFIVVTLASEALLLFVAAQAGFIDGPRVMANMAHDSWLPHRFSALSDRLTMQNGVLLMGATSLIMLIYTRGSVDALVLMYSINVFVTFSLSQAGMIRFWLMPQTRSKHPDWAQQIVIHVIGFVLCFGILLVNVLALQRRLHASQAARPDPRRAPDGGPDPRAGTAQVQADGGAAGGELLRARDPFAPDGDEALPALFRERGVHVGGGGRQCHLPGRGRGRSGPRRDRGGAQEVRRAGARARHSVRLPDVDGHRSDQRVRAAGGRGRARLRAQYLLCRQADFRARAVVGPPAAQRDRVPDPAASAICRIGNGDPACQGTRVGSRQCDFFWL